MAYYMDLENFTIENFRDWLKAANLIPSWIVLRENLPYLDTIKRNGICHLRQLKNTLKNKSKMQAFASESGLPITYLSVLRRVIAGFHPKPNQINDFPGVNKEIVKKLERKGIKNTFQLHDHVDTPSKRSAFSTTYNISKEDVAKLWALTSLSRIKWVNHTFAIALFEAGYDSSQKVADADYMEMYHKVKALNQQRGFYKGTVGVSDMQRCVEAAQILHTTFDTWH